MARRTNTERQHWRGIAGLGDRSLAVPGSCPQATWASVQGDPHPTLIPSPASVFYRNQSGSLIETDPTYTKTNQVLDTYRNQLRLRAVGPDGPPPYTQCLPARPGVQWYGTIAAGATQSWFTYGWPASWHVLWTVMPLRPVPGTATFMEGPGRTGQCHAGYVLDRGEKFDLEYRQVRGAIRHSQPVRWR